jgi:hypothetical protein
MDKNSYKNKSHYHHNNIQNISNPLIPTQLSYYEILTSLVQFKSGQNGSFYKVKLNKQIYNDYKNMNKYYKNKEI